MKILWIVNMPTGKLSEVLTGKRNNGVWIDAMLSEFQGKSGYEIYVATTYPVKNRVTVTENGVTYYALTGGYTSCYNENSKKNLAEWKALIEEVKPNVIQVFGTEFTHGLCALKVKGDIPAVIYMQGVMRAIAKYYLAGIDYKTAKRTLTLRDLIKRDGIIAQMKKFYKASFKEAEMLKLAQGIISENEWCAANVKAVDNGIRVFNCPLSINKVFAAYSWQKDKIERYSIICTASGYTIKGLHVVIKALSLLKAKYTSVKLYVPGRPMVANKDFKSQLKKDGYTKYIEKLIAKEGVSDNIVWLGTLSQENLAKEYAKRHVFVMPSSIENHSSSLKEAMMVGMPCISSYVGGVPEYVDSGENGLLYRFEEYEVLARLIEKVFEDNALAEKLSEAARKTVLQLHNGENLFSKVSRIYEEIVNGGAKKVE